jgi:DNA-binding XRE family transcriptional regulator
MLGYSQARLGEALGIRSNTVARWERGELRMPPYLDLALQTIERDVNHPSRQATVKHSPSTDIKP